MLTTPDNLLFLHLIDDGLQDKLLHHLSWDGGEADWPVVPWVLLLALFEASIFFVPVLQHSLPTLCVRHTSPVCSATASESLTPGPSSLSL